MTTNNDSSGDDTEHTHEHEVTRRQVLAAATGAAAAGAAGYVTGTETGSAQSASGQVGTLTDPYLRVNVDRLVLVPRTSDPSSPEDGSAWYNEDA